MKREQAKTEEAIQFLMDTFGFDRIVAIRHLQQKKRLQEIAAEDLRVRASYAVDEWRKKAS